MLCKEFNGKLTTKSIRFNMERKVLGLIWRKYWYGVMVGSVLPSVKEVKNALCVSVKEKRTIESMCGNQVCWVLHGCLKWGGIGWCMGENENAPGPPFIY